MTAAAPLERAFVNDGGDIAVFVAEGHALDVGVAGDFSRGATPLLNGRLRLEAGSGIGGIATSGARGRSFSLGIADAVTALARTAAAADVAATLIANAVSLDSPSIIRRPARALDPDSDLGDLLVTVDVGPLSAAEIDAALASGLARAAAYHRRGLIADACLMLAGDTRTLGDSPSPHAVNLAAHAISVGSRGDRGEGQRQSPEQARNRPSIAMLHTRRCRQVCRLTGQKAYGVCVAQADSVRHTVRNSSPH